MNEALFFTTHRMPVAVAAQARGFEVHVAAPFDADAVAVIERHGFTYHPIPLDRGSRNPLAELKLLLSFWRLIGRLAPTLTHHVAMKPVAYGGVAARLRRVPAAVFAVTGLGFLFIRDGLATRLLRRVIFALFGFAFGHPNARVIFQNEDDRALFRARGAVTSMNAVLIRGTGVDLTAFALAPEPEGPPVVMFPARLIGDKGIHEFIAAAREIKRRGVAARFVLVGRTDPINPTAVDEATVRGWEAEGLVEWWGFRRDIAAALAAAHIVCMPSYREGLPRILIEAAASGRPIVTADVPGCREIVRHDVNGLLVPVRDAAATAVAIGRLIADRDLRARLGRQGRMLAEAEYGVEAFVARTLAVYDTVLAETSGR